MGKTKKQLKPKSLRKQNKGLRKTKRRGNKNKKRGGSIFSCMGHKKQIIYENMIDKKDGDLSLLEYNKREDKLARVSDNKMINYIVFSDARRELTRSEIKDKYFNETIRVLKVLVNSKDCINKNANKKDYMIDQVYDAPSISKLKFSDGTSTDVTNNFVEEKKQIEVLVAIIRQMILLKKRTNTLSMQQLQETAIAKLNISNDPNYDLKSVRAGSVISQEKEKKEGKIQVTDESEIKQKFQALFCVIGTNGPNWHSIISKYLSTSDNADFKQFSGDFNTFKLELVSRDDFKSTLSTINGALSDVRAKNYSEYICDSENMRPAIKVLRDAVEKLNSDEANNADESNWI